MPVFMSGGVGAANPIESVHGVETEFYDFFDKDSHIWDAGYESYMTPDVGSIAEIDEVELELLDIGSLYSEVITPCCTVQAAENIHGQAAGAVPPGFQSTANRSEHPNEQPMPVGSIAPNQSLAIGSSAAGDRSMDIGSSATGDDTSSGETHDERNEILLCLKRTHPRQKKHSLQLLQRYKGRGW